MQWKIIGIWACLLLAADSPKGDSSRMDLETMQGDWALESMVADGSPVPDDDAQCLFRTVKGDQYTVFHFEKEISKGSFKIDASKNPKTIDFYPGTTMDKTKAMAGIYAVDKDTLKICYATPGKDRPKEFASKKDSSQTLAIWKREKK